MKRFCLLLLSLLATTAIWGQTAVSGVVQDSSGQPIVGAGVVQVGSATNGVTCFPQWDTHFSSLLR